MNFLKSIISILVFSFWVNSLLAQDSVSNVSVPKGEPVVEKIAYPKFKIGGLFQARYLYSGGDHRVDIEGTQRSNGDYVSNSFEIKRMRFSVNAELTKNLSVVTLVNLADFKSDTKTKVLENAYAQYTFSKYLKAQIGQFRPAFGIEDSHPVDVVKSIDYSNGYYLLGNNGWQSFQIGAGLSGVVNLGKVPLNYGFSMTNGNGKNSLDNDDGKHYASRFSFTLDEKRKLALGFSAGAGKERDESIYALGVEATYRLNLSDKLSIHFQAEAFQATNYNLYFSTADEDRQGPIKDYVMKDFYILPNIRYVIGKPHLQAVDFSLRYEYLDANAKLNSNSRQTLVPMASLEFLKDYGARIQVGVQIDDYKKSIKNTKTHDGNLYFVQLQCRLQ